MFGLGQHAWTAESDQAFANDVDGFPVQSKGWYDVLVRHRSDLGEEGVIFRYLALAILFRNFAISAFQDSLSRMNDLEQLKEAMDWSRDWLPGKREYRLVLSICNNELQLLKGIMEAMRMS